MSLLDVKNLSYSIKNKQLYNNCSFDLLNNEKMGIVGQNGAGKSTLMNILIHKVEPDQGEVIFAKNLKIGYLDQHVEIEKDITIFEYLKLAFKDLYATEEKLNNLYASMGESADDKLNDKIEELQNKLIYENFYEVEPLILKTAAGLGVNKIGMDKMLSQISGGQRAKVILTKLLLEKPDLLLLDEPTNFLDREHVVWLQEYLKKLTTSYIIISHDFDFLNYVTNCIIDIEFSKIKKYTGSFNQFLKEKESNRETYIQQFESQKKVISHLQEYYDKNHARASTAKSAQSKLKQLEKIDKISPPQSTLKPTFTLKPASTPAGLMLLTKKLTIGYTKPLISNIDLEINAKDKLVLIGFNGLGKSTMVKTLLGIIPKISGEFK
jgi:ATPase subunit of ABC transporter with duplicated ATPase domains